MKRQGSQLEGSFVYRTIVSGVAGSNDFQVEVFRSKEDMESNASPYKVLTSLDEFLDFME